MTTAKKPKFSRILLKLSGEALGGDTGVGISPEAVQHMAGQIREVRELGVQVVVVVGGGNIFRGLSGSERGIERATGDYMGMLATIINALALAGRAGKTRLRPRACKAPSPCRRSPNPSSAGARCGIWKKAAWSFSAAARAILIFPRTPPPRCAPTRSARK